MEHLIRAIRGRDTGMQKPNSMYCLRLEESADAAKCCLANFLILVACPAIGYDEKLIKIRAEPEGRTDISAVIHLRERSKMLNPFIAAICRSSGQPRRRTP